jgi:phage tail-like protein
MPNTAPLEIFSFQLAWTLRRSEVLRVSGLRSVTAVTSHHDSTKVPSLNQKLPGLTAYEPITIEREVEVGDEDFQNWAIQAVNQESGFRQNIAIILMDGQGNPAVRFQVFDCWPSMYEAFVELNADATGVVTERITLEYQSFKRADS